MKNLKYYSIEYVDRNTRETKTKSVDKVFTLAVVNLPWTTGAKDKEKWMGMSIGISIQHKDINDADKFYKAFLGDKENFYLDDKNNKNFDDIYLYMLAKNNIKIPVLYQCGNSYEPDMGTSCLFVWFNGYLAGPDMHDRPKMKHFGSVALEGKFGRYPR